MFHPAIIANINMNIQTEKTPNNYDKSNRDIILTIAL